MGDLEMLANQVEYIDKDSDQEELAKGDKIMHYLETNKGLHDKILSIMQNIEGKVRTIRHPPQAYNPKVDPSAL